MSNIIVSEQQKLICKSCSMEISVFNSNEYFVIACPRCFAINTRIYNSKYEKIRNLWKKEFFIIPLYTKCYYENKNLIVVGAVIKEDLYESWIEYHLLDESKKSYFLSQWRGHYHFFEQIDPISFGIFETINLNSRKLKTDQKSFLKLSKYNPSTKSFIGEFNYNVLDIRGTTCIDFINPPEILSYEKSDDSTTLFFGKYLNKSEINKMFPDFEVVNHDFSTVGMAQPFLRGLNLQLFNKILLSFLALFLVIHIAIHADFSSFKIIELDKLNTASGAENVSQTFVLKEKLGDYYLRFSAQTYLNNQWIEDQITLVNESTGEEREFSIGMEYYSGVDNGYSWAEGDNAGEVYLSNVKAGRYHLKEKFVTSDNSDISFYMGVYVDSPANWNFFFIFFTCIVIFLVINFLNAKFEEKRTDKPHGIFANIFKSKYD